MSSLMHHSNDLGFSMCWDLWALPFVFLLPSVSKWKSFDSLLTFTMTSMLFVVMVSIYFHTYRYQYIFTPDGNSALVLTMYVCVRKIKYYLNYNEFNDFNTIASSYFVKLWKKTIEITHSLGIVTKKEQLPDVWVIRTAAVSSGQNWHYDNS